MSVLVDAIGTHHVPVTKLSDGTLDCRIVSLVPSLTELLCDLGLTTSLVGRTGFCIHPEQQLAPIPKIGGTKDVNIEKIRKLAPTHLIVNIDENEKPTVDALAEFIPHIIVTHPITPLDNLDLYHLFGAVFHAQTKAENLCRDLQQAYDALQAQRNNKLQRVLYCIWKDPWMTVARDTYIAQMLALINLQQWECENSTLRYPIFTWTPQLVEDIDLIFLSSEPYHFTDEHCDALEKQCGKPVQLIDGEMLSWYGSRAIAGLRYLHNLQAE
jgi:ABC-type Fe3+-hydroxamate transport system substrate-binding protein